MSADWLFKVGFNSAVEAAAYRRDWAGTFLREVGVAISAALGYERGCLLEALQATFTRKEMAEWIANDEISPFQFGYAQPHDWIDQ